MATTPYTGPIRTARGRAKPPSLTTHLVNAHTHTHCHTLTDTATRFSFPCFAILPDLTHSTTFTNFSLSLYCKVSAHRHTHSHTRTHTFWTPPAAREARRSMALNFFLSFPLSNFTTDLQQHRSGGSSQNLCRRCRAPVNIHGKKDDAKIL